MEVFMVTEFFTDNGFVLELLAATALFCHFLDRRPHFIGRALAFAFAMMAFSVAYNFLFPLSYPVPAIRTLIRIAKYLGFFAIGLAGIYFCFETNLFGALFCINCALATQHLCYRAYAVILIAFGKTYSSRGSTIIILLGTAFVYTLVYIFFVRKLKKHPEEHLENRLNIVVGAILVVTNVLLLFMMENYIAFEGEAKPFLLLSCYHVILCVFTLMIEQGFLQNIALSRDKDMLEHLLSMQEEKFQTTKASMDMINIKCHDMKHQISHMTGRLDHDSVEELERIINIYDSNLKTGNEALDICLMEKKLLCERDGISFDCIADGSCLSFMPAADVFSLFGNALDNAIEACTKIQNAEKRIISLTVRRQLGMAVIHVENNFEGNLTFANGLPQTTKSDKNYHGFGMQSIRMIADKYKGTVAILNQDGVFNLNITIPIPA